jgi:hypothetical protein
LSKKPPQKVINKKVVKFFLKRAWACVGMCGHVWACVGTEHRAQSTEHRAQSTEHKAKFRA